MLSHATVISSLDIATAVKVIPSVDVRSVDAKVISPSEIISLVIDVHSVDVEDNSADLLDFASSWITSFEARLSSIGFMSLLK